MEFVFGFLFLVIVVVLAKQVSRYKTLHPFLPRKYNFDKRRNTLRDTLRLLDQRGARSLVETGTARGGLNNSKGDGASTVVFGLWASQNNAHLHSVDIDPSGIEESGNAVEAMGLSDYVTLVTSDSVEFLEKYDKPVDFLYLDSYDYHKTDLAIQAASQAHHLQEIEAIVDQLHYDSVILIDDCGQPNGGKGKLAIEFLSTRGWRIYKADYQVIIVWGGG